MLLNSSPAVGERDIDAILEDIQPPSDLLAALKPIPSCTVANFLLICAPPRPGSRKYFLEASSWFSLEPPNDKLDDVGDLILPSEKLCDTLDSHLRKAIDQGMCSLQQKVMTTIMSTPWHMGYRALQNGTVSTTTLALLLSDKWLNDERMDCIG